MIDVDITQLCNVYVLRAYQTNNSVCSFFFQQVEMLSFVRESGPQRQTMTKLSVRKRTKKIKKNQQKPDNNTDFDLLQLVPQEGRRYMVKDSSKD